MLGVCRELSSLNLTATNAGNILIRQFIRYTFLVLDWTLLTFRTVLIFRDMDSTRFWNSFEILLYAKASHPKGAWIEDLVTLEAI